MYSLKTILFVQFLIVVTQITKCDPTTEPSNEKGILSHFPKDTLEANLTGKEIRNLNRGDVKGFDNLFDLILCNNGIENIEPGTFEDVPNLERVNLSGNALTKIQNGVFNNLYIKVLDLSSNKISVIEEEAFYDMPELKSLYLGNNEIDKWNPNWFQNAPQLIRLVFNHNKLNALPKNAFQNLESARTDNKTDMCWFDFSNNQITELHPESFAGVKYLDGINLRNNSISTLSPGLFSSVERASLVWLWYNEITCVSEEFLENLSPAVLGNIELDFNPWNCTCVKKVHEWSKVHGKPLLITLTYIDCDADAVFEVDE